MKAYDLLYSSISQWRIGNKIKKNTWQELYKYWNIYIFLQLFYGARVAQAVARLTTTWMVGGSQPTPDTRA